jgi:tripeptidyl-peptidase-1
MLFTTAFSLLNFITFVSSKLLAARLEYEVKETHYTLSDWKIVRPADHAHRICLNIALRTNNDELEQSLYASTTNHSLLQNEQWLTTGIVSDPAHERYGQHLSAKQVDSLIAPADQTISLVEQWLRDHDIHDFQYNSAKDWIKTGLLPLQKVEYLLDTKYFEFRNIETNVTAIRTQAWSLPSH